MTITFKQLALTALLIGVVTIAVSSLSKTALPLIFFSESSLPESQLRQDFEGNLESEISNMLKVLYGRKNFFVSISTDVNNVKRETEEVFLEPVVISKNAEEVVTGEFEFLQRALFENKPSASEIKRRLSRLEETAELQGGIPGLVSSRQISDKITEDLPGFPTIESDPSLPDPTSAESEKDGDKSKNQNSDLGKRNIAKNTNEDVVVFNKTTSKTTIPTNKIDRLYVSILIDEERFNLTGIEQASLIKLIKNVSGYNELRGDQLILSVIPFPQTGFNVSNFWLKNKDSVTAIKSVIHKLRFLLIGLTLSLLFEVIGYYVGRKIVATRARMAKEQEIINRKKQIEDEDIELKQKTAFEKRKEEVFGLAKTKPEDFAKVLINWIEKSN